MTTYYPDNWVILHLKGDKPHYRVLAGWSGGYLHGDSWRLNSGITKILDDEDYYHFYGSSGSCYQCHKQLYGLRSNISYIYDKLKTMHEHKIELMDENTDWLNLEYK